MYIQKHPSVLTVVEDMMQNAMVEPVFNDVFIVIVIASMVCLNI